MSQRSSSEHMVSSNGKGIKHNAYNIRMDHNLCVIRDNGPRRARSVQGKKKKRKKEGKGEKNMEIGMEEHFFLETMPLVIISEEVVLPGRTTGS